MIEVRSVQGLDKGEYTSIVDVPNICSLGTLHIRPRHARCCIADRPVHVGAALQLSAVEPVECMGYTTSYDLRGVPQMRDIGGLSEGTGVVRQRYDEGIQAYRTHNEPFRRWNGAHHGVALVGRCPRCGGSVMLDCRTDGLPECMNCNRSFEVCFGGLREVRPVVADTCVGTGMYR